MSRRSHPVSISIEDVKAHLTNGITRCVGDAGYNAKLGSIQEKYGLSKVEVKQLFNDERLQGLRVKPVKIPAFIIQEDEVNNEILAGPGTETPAEAAVQAVAPAPQMEYIGGTDSDGPSSL